MITLFLGSFLAATLLPGGSELLFVWMLQQDNANPIGLITTATGGNALGSMVTFMMGVWLHQHWCVADFVKPRQQLALNWLQAHGHWALLLSWLPIVGDPLCLIAGWMKFNPYKAALVIVVSKGLRYALLSAVVMQWL